MEKIPKNIFSKEKLDKVGKKRSDFLLSLEGDDLLDMMDRFTIKARELDAKYPKPEKYAMYHVLVGSTIHDDMYIEHEDFPGEDSVELFIDNLVSGK